MDELFGRLVCCTCRRPLGTARTPGGDLACPDCGRTYPVLWGRVPVLMPEPRRHLAKCCLSLGRSLLELDEMTREFGVAAEAEPRRAAILASMRDATSANREFLAGLQSQLSKVVPFDELVAQSEAPAPEHPTLHKVRSEYTASQTILDYLHLDWSESPGAAEYREALRSALLPMIPPRTADSGTALVLGAGAGRMAWELRDYFPTVVATDISPTMAYFFDSVGRGPVVTYAVCARNQVRRSEMVRRVVAEVPAPPPARRAGQPGEIVYMLADGLAVPLAPHSVSAIISVYFTDVVPLEALLAEAMRLLRPGGVFVHLGPLSYHSWDVAQWLAADEVRELFERRGFSVATDRMTPVNLRPGLMKNGAMLWLATSYWVFSAIRGGGEGGRRGDGSSPVTLDSVFRRVGSLRYETRGLLPPEGGSRDVEIRLVPEAGETVETDGTVLEVLRLLDGIRSAAEVVELFRRGGLGADVDPGQILDILERLQAGDLIQPVK